MSFVPPGMEQQASPLPGFSFSSAPQGAPSPSPAQSQANKDGRSLYVGNLDPEINEEFLWGIFSEAGHVESCKIIKDRVANKNNYGFVDFFRREDAEQGLLLNGKKLHDQDIKVNWASHSNRKEDTSNHFNIFVGDLSSEVTNEVLHKAFEAFGSITDARVMWDQSTGRSRGYGFVAFREKPDAERAMNEMNGTFVGNRAIRCNWANQKTNSRAAGNSGHSSGQSSPHGTPKRSVNFEEVASQSAHTNSTVYVGNLPPDTPEAVLRSNFQHFGAIEEVRIQQGRCFAFVKFQNHDQATRAIIASNDMTIGGQPIRCSWGKQKTSEHHQQPAAYPNTMYNANQFYGQQPYAMYPYYNPQAPYYQAPDPNFYAQAFDTYTHYAMQYQQPHPQYQQPPPQVPPQMQPLHMAQQYMNYPR